MEIESFTSSSAAGLTRYRVSAGTRVFVAEGFCMHAENYFNVRGLLLVQGVVKVGG